MKRIVIGITGASGAPYAARVLDFLRDEATDVEPHLVFTKYGRLVWGDEIGTDPKDAYPFPIYASGDMLAPFASGSAGFEAMAVVPCSATTVGRIASGASSDLISRAADVMLKERRKLVVVVRESPYNLIHLRNMTTLCEAGAVVMPASPSFYGAPKTMDELVDTVTARILDQLGVPNERTRRWTGELQGGSHDVLSLRKLRS